MEERYIFKSIKTYYLRHTIIPLMLVLFAVFFQIAFGVFGVLFPQHVRNNAEISESSEYVDIVLDEIFPAGYQMLDGNSIMGNYYYGFYNGRCLYVLLPMNATNGEPSLKNYHLFAKKMHEEADTSSITEKISSDLGWSTDSLANSSYPFILSHIGSHLFLDRLLAVVLGITLVVSLFFVIYDILSAFIPKLSPPAMRLRRYGNPEELLAIANDELSTLPQLATEDMFITEHFFIEISTFGIAVVPIDQIVWIYKHSTLHEFFGIHFNIDYTLHICAHGRFYFNCPKNTISDIDGIIDYLQEANHDIIVGFTPENKALAKERTKNDPSIRQWIRDNS